MTLASATHTLADLRVDGARLWQSLMDLARIGGTEKGGVCRLALTDPGPAGPGPVRQLGDGRGL